MHSQWWVGSKVQKLVYCWCIGRKKSLLKPVLQWTSNTSSHDYPANKPRKRNISPGGGKMEMMPESGTNYVLTWLEAVQFPFSSHGKEWAVHENGSPIFLLLFLKKDLFIFLPSVMAHDLNPRKWRQRYLWVYHQPGLHSEALFQKWTKQNRKKNTFLFHVTWVFCLLVYLGTTCV